MKVDESTKTKTVFVFRWGHLNIRNALTVGSPQVLCLLALDFTATDTDNNNNNNTLNTVFIRSNTLSWKWAPGPLLKNSIYLGEWYDSNLEIPDWASAELDDAVWSPAVTPYASPSLSIMHSASTDPIRAFSFTPIAITQPTGTSVNIFDMGVNYSGWMELCVRADALASESNNTVVFRYGELLYPDGTLNVATSTAGQIHAGNGGPCAPYTAYQTDTFVLSRALPTSTPQCYRPRFTWHGFRYAEVSGYSSSSPPVLTDAMGWRVHADLEQVGTFANENTLYTQIHSLVIGSFLSNLLSVQSDCPHRERFGYGGDVLTSCEAAMRNFNMHSFYSKVRFFVSS